MDIELPEETKYNKINKPGKQKNVEMNSRPFVDNWKINNIVFDVTKKVILGNMTSQELYV